MPWRVEFVCEFIVYLLWCSSREKLQVAVRRNSRYVYTEEYSSCTKDAVKEESFPYMHSFMVQYRRHGASG